MSVIWISQKYLQELEESKQAIQDQMLAGVKDIQQYEFLRGRYSSLVEAEDKYRELLDRVTDDDISNRA